MVSDPILYPEDFEKDKDAEIIKLTGRIQSLHADLDLFAKEKAALKEENEKYRLGMQENCELRAELQREKEKNIVHKTEVYFIGKDGDVWQQTDYGLKKCDYIVGVRFEHYYDINTK